MKKILTVFLILNITSLLFADPDFRKVNWGDSMEHVRNTETAVLNAAASAESPDCLVYDIVLSHFETLLIYLFAHDTLVRTGYIFLEDHRTNMNSYIDNFEKIDGLLHNKYGDPVEERIDWADDYFKDNKSDWGYALRDSDLEFYTAWQTSETWIEHSLDAHLFDVSHTITYISLELLDFADQAEAEGL